MRSSGHLIAAVSLIVSAAGAAVPSDGPSDYEGSPVAAAAKPPASGAPAAPDGCRGHLINFWDRWFVAVSWNDRSDNEDGFTVEWRTSRPRQSGTFTIAADTTSALVWAGYSGSKAECRVRAYNASGVSGWSNWASVAVP